MLSTLRIRNLALVTDLTVEFQEGLNVITGETGAGKSILLGALNLVLGARADRTLIRSGADQCSVEAVFHVGHLRAPLAPFLEENGLEPCEDHHLVLKRTFTDSGTNRQFVNGSPTTLQVLSRVGDWLVDIHGSHDHQTLLRPARQLEFLDAFAKLDSLRQSFAQLLNQRRRILDAKAALVMDEQSYTRQLDLLRFQVSEIQSARLDPDEETAVQEQYERSHNAAQLLDLGQTAAALLDAEEDSILPRMGWLGRALRDLERTDPAARNLVLQHEQLTETLRELQSALSTYVDRIDLDPERLRALEERWNLIQSLKRKYGRTLAEVVRFGQEALDRLSSLERREGELERLQAEQAKVESLLWQAGHQLSTARRKAAPKLAKAVTRHLEDLGFRQNQFSIALESAKPDPEFAQGVTASGLDSLDFQFSPNPGEPPRPLRAIASSGELARVMLALRTLLASDDEIPVLIFDEVDANVGGEIARVVGEKMRHLARRHQVFCVTHLAPVAAFAQAHYRVTKKVEDGRTHSIIDRLDADARLDELSRMLGGTPAVARRLAQDILRSLDHSTANPPLPASPPARGT